MPGVTDAYPPYVNRDDISIGKLIRAGVLVTYMSGSVNPLSMKRGLE